MQNIRELRMYLTENLKKIENGELNLQKALEICRTSQVIINTIKLEIDYHKQVKSKDKIEFLENMQ